MAHCFLVDPYNGKPLAIFEDYTELEWVRSWRGAGSFQMKIPRAAYNARWIRRGTIFGPTDDPRAKGPDQLFMVEQIEEEIGPDGRASDIIIASGRSIGGMLEERLVVPPAGQSHDTQSNVPAETAMKHYVNAHAGPGAAPARQVPNLVIAPDKGRGQKVTAQGRYQTVAEILEEIGFLSSMGWEITLDRETGQYVFDVIPGVNRAVGSQNPVIFDVDLESAVALRRLQTDAGRKNFAYVGGQGEGVERVIRTVYLDDTEPTGFERRELWVDARDLEDANALPERGKAKLIETGEDDAIEAQPNQAGPFRYRVHWDLGDIVTVRYKPWGLQVDMRIVTVRNKISPGAGETEITIELGSPWPTLRDIIRRREQRSGGERE